MDGSEDCLTEGEVQGLHASSPGVNVFLNFSHRNEEEQAVAEPPSHRWSGWLLFPLTVT